jgi:hypothetical protein
LPNAVSRRRCGNIGKRQFLLAGDQAGLADVHVALYDGMKSIDDQIIELP